MAACDKHAKRGGEWRAPSIPLPAPGMQVRSPAMAIVMTSPHQAPGPQSIPSQLRPSSSIARLHLVFLFYCLLFCP